MDDVLAVKTDRLLRCLKRIEAKTPESLDVLVDDFDLQDILILNLERAVQQTVDIAVHLLSQKGVPVPSTMREAFDELQQQGMLSVESARDMKHAVGFRNTAVHAYQQIDWAIVYSIATQHIEDFKIFLREISRAI